MLEKVVEDVSTDGQIYDKKTIQANFSSLLYLLTEQQAMIGKLFQALLDSGALDSAQLSRITDLSGEKNDLIPTYTQLYQRYAAYYLRTKELLDTPPDVNGRYHDPLPGKDPSHV